MSKYQIMKDKIAKKIAWLLPPRIVIWVVIRAFAWTSTHECSNKVVDQITYEDVYKSWENKL